MGEKIARLAWLLWKANLLNYNVSQDQRALFGIAIELAQSAPPKIHAKPFDLRPSTKGLIPERFDRICGNVKGTGQKQRIRMTRLIACFAVGTAAKTFYDMKRPEMIINHLRADRFGPLVAKLFGSQIAIVLALWGLSLAI